MSTGGQERAGWWLDELAHAGRENLDGAHAAHYDTKEDAGAASEVATLERLGLGGDSVVLEFGAGTGQFTVEAAKRCRRVIAVDVSPVMLGQLEEKTAALGLDNVEVVRAGFLSYEHDADPADFIYSRFALHHIPDFWKVLALERMRRMVVPGGAVRLADVVYGFEPAEAEERIEAWCAMYGDGGEGEWGRADVEEHVRDEHSTFTWLLEPMIERAGFEIEDAEYSDGVLARYVLRA